MNVMKVMKFGGSSMGTSERVRGVIQLVEESKEQNFNVVVVVSAFSGVTESLIKMGRLAAVGDRRYHAMLDALEIRHIDLITNLLEEGELKKCIISNLKGTFKELYDVLHGVYLLKELSLRSLDFIMSFGELLSAYILAEAFKSRGSDAEFLDARTLIKTDDSFGNALVYFERAYQNIQEYFNEHSALQVVTGFIASTFRNETTTIGRGGSDFTASIIGRALKASSIEIWTDVDGVMTADPRKVKKAFPIDAMTYEEAMEMSHFGATVLHPPTMHPAVEENIPVVIKNSFRPQVEGTRISNEVTKNGYIVKGISSIDDVALLRVQGPGMVGIAGTSMRLFGTLAKKGINVIMITQASSEHSICLAVDPKFVKEAKREIEDEFSLEIYAHKINAVIIERDLSIIAVVGERMCHSLGIAGRVFSSLGKNSVNVVAIAQGSSELNISFVLNKKDEIKALNVIHDAFFHPPYRPINLFLVGTGLVGASLLSQLMTQRVFLKEKHRVEIRVVGLANSRKMLFDDSGINLLSWKENLQSSLLDMEIEKFIQMMKDFNLRNTIFVDCTASEKIPLSYKKILQNYSVVTPNKTANTTSYKSWHALREVMRKSHAKFFYETNVGAALPVINTLHGLLYSGDQISKIETVISGTLSYIFNTVSKDKSFSAVFREAINKGYTEPDPRGDLSGHDVARKILILARECGSEMELEDVEIEKFIPEESFSISLESFFKKIEELDEPFEERRKTAEKAAKKLRYVASYEGNVARVFIAEVGMDHPFYSLSGNDNMVAFTTKRYEDCPLVIRGPGAGGEVTAGGVFADIMQCSHDGEESQPWLQ